MDTAAVTAPDTDAVAAAASVTTATPSAVRLPTPSPPSPASYDPVTLGPGWLLTESADATTDAEASVYDEVTLETLVEEDTAAAAPHATHSDTNASETVGVGVEEVLVDVAGGGDKAATATDDDHDGSDPGTPPRRCLSNAPLTFTRSPHVASATTSAASASTWNDKLQALLDSPCVTVYDGLQRTKALSALAAEFEAAQRPRVKAIVEETIAGTPDSQRTVQPASVSEHNLAHVGTYAGVCSDTLPTPLPASLAV